MSGGANTYRDEPAARRRYERTARIIDERATGRRRFKSASQALRWWATTRDAWSSARGLAVDPEREGTGAPNRGADDPKRVAFAAVAYAVKLGRIDDEERNPSRPAPLEAWLRLHFLGRGRNSGLSYEQLAEEQAGFSAVDIGKRVQRAIRVVSARLKAGGWFERGEDGDDAL